MKSPYTGKPMILVKEPRTIEFRKEFLEIVFHFYRCEDTREQFTSSELDELNMGQVYNQYREKYNIPFPDEITKIRAQYDVPANRMSEILGFGVNSYRQYESGDIPSTANAKLIQMAKDPEKFLDMIHLCTTLEASVKAKYLFKTKALIQEKEKNKPVEYLKNYFVGTGSPGIYSGYRNPDLDKFTAMVVYFSEQLSPFKTKMNKLLFYADFLMFKTTGFSISGLSYSAIAMGPVPYHFQTIYEYLALKGDIEIITTEFPDGGTGERFKTSGKMLYIKDAFSESEWCVLKKVANSFKKTSTADIIAISHSEKAWLDNYKNNARISYQYAFDLLAV
jgi:uncharacterized phage-associated protein/DNA-binding transcriptional regulator YiaG